MNFQKSDRYAGGIARMWILPLDKYQGVTYEPASGLFSITGVKNNIVEVPFARDSAGWRIRCKNCVYRIDISSFISGITANNLHASINIENSPFLLIVQDYNNNFLLFGDYDNFFLYSPDIDSNTDYSDTSGIDFNLEREMMSAPIFVVDVVHFNTPPKASGLRISPAPEVNVTVVGSYSYTDADNDPEGASELLWFIADDESGTNLSQIGTGLSLLLDESMVNKYICFSVKPFDGKDFGEQIFSDFYIVAEKIISAPVALNVDIRGTFQPFGQVYGFYKYFDEAGRPEYKSLWRYYVSDDADGTKKEVFQSYESQEAFIGSSYTAEIPERFVGKYVAFSVRPSNAYAIGIEKFSSFMLVNQQKYPDLKYIFQNVDSQDGLDLDAYGESNYLYFSQNNGISESSEDTFSMAVSSVSIFEFLSKSLYITTVYINYSIRINQIIDSDYAGYGILVQNLDGTARGTLKRYFKGLEPNIWHDFLYTFKGLRYADLMRIYLHSDLEVDDLKIEFRINEISVSGYDRTT
jgi:hypothetical protein